MPWIPEVIGAIDIKTATGPLYYTVPGDDEFIYFLRAPGQYQRVVQFGLVPGLGEPREFMWLTDGPAIRNVVTLHWEP